MEPHDAGLVVLALIVLFFLVAVLRIAGDKGKSGESKVNDGIRLFLDQSTYRLIHDVTLPTSNGTTQIDHIVLSPYGIFVIETKNMDGWIFGDQYQARWTQQVYQRRETFQNPLRQNYRHVKAVQALLELASHEIFSVVVFVGDCTFKSPMPSEVVQGVAALCDYIKSKRDPVFAGDDLPAIADRLSSQRLQPGTHTDRAHARNVAERSLTRRAAVDLCPRCGGKMVIRTNKAYNVKFLGCTHYPQCSGTRPLS